ncbi:MAG: DUF4112 domain-containing protein [Cyclobacteriaceae bacterium]
MADLNSPLKNTPTELAWIEKLTHWMDTAFRIPGTNIRFGLDPIIGLIPFLGDMLGYAISGTMILSMVRKGISMKVALLMIANIVFDYLLSSIPILGDIFDFGFKANQRNLLLLKKHQLEGKYKGGGIGLLLLVFALLILIMLALVYLVTRVLIGWFQWLGSVGG